MKKSKKIFIGIGILFIIATLIVGYDISSKTSFPGSKKLLKESIAPSAEEKEEVENDSTEVNLEEIKER
jgi:hypothetical protein